MRSSIRPPWRTTHGEPRILEPLRDGDPDQRGGGEAKLPRKVFGDRCHAGIRELPLSADGEYQRRTTGSSAQVPFQTLGSNGIELVEEIADIERELFWHYRPTPQLPRGICGRWRLFRWPDLAVRLLGR